MLRKQAIDEVLLHPQWSLQQSVRHLRQTMRLTSAELAQMAGINAKTLHEIEQGRSLGTVQTLNKVLAVMGLKLGVVALK